MYHVDRMEAVHNELEVLEADIIGSFQMAMRKDKTARQCEKDFKAALERMYELATFCVMMRFVRGCSQTKA